MYYLVFGFLYLVSLLPFFILYRISDLVAFLMHSVFGYRKEVVMQNLDIAFPEKTGEEKKRIAKRFYRNMTDTFIESLKLLSISNKAILNRVEHDFSAIYQEIAKGRNVQVHIGHQFNWEYAFRIGSILFPIPLYGIYMKINNSLIDRIFYKLRTIKGGHMIAAHEFKSRAHQMFQSQYAIGLVADQNPGVPARAYWLNFFNQPAPFPTGPDKGAIRNSAVIVFVQLQKFRRGYYRFTPHIISSNGAEFSEGDITRLYRDFLERNIRQDPDNYLWSHRRWKWPYKKEYESMWIDTVPPPAEQAG